MPHDYRRVLRELARGGGSAGGGGRQRQVRAPKRSLDAVGETGA